MNSRRKYLSAAALALIVSLSVSPLAFGFTPRTADDAPVTVKERVIQIVQKIQRFFTIKPLEDPIPPRP